VWSGVGTASIAIIGFAAFKEMITPMKLVGIGLIIAGVVVLELFSRAGHAPPGIR
jgi:small multidrug resistance pump